MSGGGTAAFANECAAPFRPALTLRVMSPGPHERAGAFAYPRKGPTNMTENKAGDYTRSAVAAITQATEHEQDFGGWLARVLAAVAAERGSSDALTERRPGSWEASLVDQLVKGTVGWADEYLSRYLPGEG